MATQMISRRKSTSPLVQGLGPASDPDKFLDQALDAQAERLFRAEAIIQTVAAAIEERYGDDIDDADGKTPNYCNALEVAADLIRAAYGNLEMPALRAIAVTLEVKVRQGSGS